MTQFWQDYMGGVYYQIKMLQYSLQKFLDVVYVPPIFFCCT